MRPKERRKFLKQLNRKMRGEEKKVGKKKERRENLYLVSSDDESLQKIIKLQDINSPVKAFCNWLETWDGSRRANSDQYKNQVKGVADTIEATDILDTVDSDLIAEQWVREAEKLYSPNTVVAYLHPLSHFVEFLLTNWNINHEFSESQQRDLRYFQAQLTRWRKSYAKDQQRRHWEKMAEFTAKPLTVADVEEYENFASCRGALCLLSELMGQKKLRTVENSTFTQVRNYLICKMILRNAQRGGVLANMTSGEWLTGKPSKEDSRGVSVTVSKTKTGHKQATVLDFDSHLKSAMDLYFKNVRHWFAKTQFKWCLLHITPRKSYFLQLPWEAHETLFETCSPGSNCESYKS